jgi:hypothetical protein
MLVLMGPSFGGTPAEYQRLSKVTGMVSYDLKARVKPGMWGLLKALADATEAERLAASLFAEGFPAVAVPREVATDLERPIVALQGLLITEQGLMLTLREREMQVPLAALCCIVRGEAQVGKGSAGRPITGGGSPYASSSTFRAVVPSSSDLQVFRESMAPASFEAFAAADLHFHSVTWVARIDARAFDFKSLGIAATSPASALDQLVDQLGQLASVRVDRSARASSVGSFTQRAARSQTPVQAQPHTGPKPKEIAGDERFDPYSRVIAEAERLWAVRQSQRSTPPAQG